MVFMFNKFIRTASISTHMALHKQEEANNADNVTNYTWLSITEVE